MAEGITDTIGSGVEDAGSAGAGSGPPTTPTPAATPPPRPPVHRRRWFLPVLVLSLLVIAGGALAVIALLGGSGDDSLHRSLDDALFDERYRADLTAGHGDFPASTDEQSSSTYAPDGYHLRTTSPYPAPRGVQANGSHSVLGVRISTRAVEAPAGSMFGPFCWHTATEGYGLLVGADGVVRIVETTPNRTTAYRVLRTTSGPTIDWSAWHTLRLDCSLRGTGPDDHTTAELVGYVDGVRAGRATSTRTASVFKYTGFTVSSAEVQPAEWVVRTFDRLGADDVWSRR